ncbi:MAG: BamA/TamA family outer membrane protein [Flavisolibacter sp.]|nr:BamA/TamA family outer membrane protein [Flavisolibacter sp.]
MRGIVLGLSLISMAKLKHLLAAISFLTTFCIGKAQSYAVYYKTPEGDISFQQKLSLQRGFSSQTEAALYIVQLPFLLQGKGYITASVDSVQYDSLFARAIVYLGEQYKWAKISTSEQDAALLQSIRWPDRLEGTVDFNTIQTWQKKILDYLEENGRPFGKVYLDSIGISGNEVHAVLKIEPGPLYKIDSIRVYGDAKISNEFLQRYLEIPNGSVYNRKKLERVSKRISEISYVQQEHVPTIDYLGTGSVLNLYLKTRKNSQANALIGFLPNSDVTSGTKKLRLTVDANILLRNALSNGETIGLIWQQLQQKSPRLNLLYEQPYIFHSPFGLNFSFDMYKRDSLFLNINMNLGTSYQLEERKTARLFLQRRQSIVSGINEATIIQTKLLPREADVSSTNLGIGYEFSNTDYRFNPRKGNEFIISSTAGTKKIRKNNQILDLKDPSEPNFKFESLYDTVKLKAYQFRIITTAAHFVPLGKQSTIKLGLNAGIYQSANYFRNELFQIGGYKLMRGFDEESQFVSQYAISTVEYRYRVGLNSFFFVFTDGGLGKHLLETKQNHSYLGTGLGLSLETKAGIVNLAGALGKRDDIPFNFRQFKVHIGFASYF